MMGACLAAEMSPSGAFGSGASIRRATKRGRQPGGGPGMAALPGGWHSDNGYGRIRLRPAWPHVDPSRPIRDLDLHGRVLPAPGAPRPDDVERPRPARPRDRDRDVHVPRGAIDIDAATDPEAGLDWLAERRPDVRIGPCLGHAGLVGVGRLDRAGDGAVDHEEEEGEAAAAQQQRQQAADGQRPFPVAAPPATARWLARWGWRWWWLL